MAKNIPSMKYCLTFEGHKLQQRKQSTKTIMFHKTTGKYYTNCGYDIHSPLTRKPTGKRYKLCGKCARA